MAILLGLVVVAAVIVGALAIEQATDNDLDLPDTLPGGLRADDASELVDSAEAGLEDVLDAPVAVRSYRTDDDERLVTLTVVDQAAGPFAPSGPQADAELLGLARGPFELVREGDVVCDLAWSRDGRRGRAGPGGRPRRHQVPARRRRAHLLARAAAACRSTTPSTSSSRSPTRTQLQ